MTTLADWMRQYDSIQAKHKGRLNRASLWQTAGFGLLALAYSFSFALIGGVWWPLLLSGIASYVFAKGALSAGSKPLGFRRILFLLECEHPHVRPSPLNLGPQSSAVEYDEFLRQFLNKSVTQNQKTHKNATLGALFLWLGFVTCAGLGGGWARLQEQLEQVFGSGGLGVLEVQDSQTGHTQSYALRDLPLSIALHTPNLLTLRSQKKLTQGATLELLGRQTPLTSLALESPFAVLENSRLLLRTKDQRAIPIATFTLEPLYPPEIRLESRVPLNDSTKWPAMKPLPLVFEAKGRVPLERIDLIIQAEGLYQRQSIKSFGRLQSVQSLQKNFLVDFRSLAKKPETKIRLMLQVMDRAKPVPLQGKSQELALTVVAPDASKDQPGGDDQGTPAAKPDPSSEEARGQSAYLEEMDMDQSYEVSRVFREDVLEDFESKDFEALPPNLVDTYLKKVVR